MGVSEFTAIILFVISCVSIIINVVTFIKNGNKDVKKDTNFENFDDEFSEALLKEDVPSIKAKAAKLENLNIFEADFKVLNKVPKSWSIIYNILTKYYAISVVSA